MGAFGSYELGSAVAYYTKEIGQSATNYYTGGPAKGEPAGYWQGKGAEKLGLVGNITEKAMKDLYEKGLDPRDPSQKFGPPPRNYRSAHERTMERLTKDGLVGEDRVEELRALAIATSDSPGEADQKLEIFVGAETGMLPEAVSQVRLEASRSVRQDNRFIDYTWSPDKTISVMHTAAEYGELQATGEGRLTDAARYRLVRERIEHWTSQGNQAALAYMNKHAAYARLGRHPGGTWSEATDWVVATFPQMTSRAQDPQLHFHNPIYLPTEVPEDGKVHKLHTTLFKTNRHAAAAVGSRVMMEGLAKELGWKPVMRTDGNGYELGNVDAEIKEWFSHGTQTINREAQKIIDEYREINGYDPIPLAVTRIKQNLALSTRARKPKDSETREEMHARWDTELRAEIGAGMARQAIKAGRIMPAPLPDDFSPDAVIKVAIAKVQQGKSTWERSDLAVEIERALPPYLGITDVNEVIDLLDTLTDVAVGRADLVVQVSNQATSLHIPADQLLANGQSAHIQPGSTRFTSRDHVASEYALQRAAIIRGRASADAAKVTAWVKAREAMDLGEDQEAALRGVATSGAAVSVIVGPAGTGKTYVAGGLAQAWRDLTGGRLIGLATSEQATDVLRGEEITAKNIAQWLGAQRRIVEGRAHDTDREFTVGPGDIIMPDEASMADTDKIAEIRGYVEAAGARLLLIGDHRQLSAVGAGGAMRLIAETEGADVYELREVRRFVDRVTKEPTEEGKKSLDLRAGVLEALDWYDMHDRIRAGGTEEDAVKMAARMYIGDRARGETSVVVTPTNRLAAIANAEIRARLIELGRVTEDGRFLDRDGNVAGVGDLVMCRKNRWSDPANLVKNRGRYLVIGHGENDELLLREEKTGREIVIDAAYVNEWVELGYAGTVHSVQGATEDNGIPIVDEAQPLEALYPAMTRGRYRNTAIVITEKVTDQEDQIWKSDPLPRDPKAVMADIIDRDNEAAKSALALSREDAERAASMETISRRYEDSVGRVVRERTADWLDRLALEGVISEGDRKALATDRATEQVGRLLRSVEQAGHDPQEALRKELEGRTFEGARAPGQVLYSRLSMAHRGKLTPDLDKAVMPPAGASKEYVEHLEELQDLGRLRRMQLGKEVVEEQPGWAIEALGWVPDDPFAVAAWEHRAGVIAAQREAMGWDHPGQALPPAPGLLHPEQRVAWYEAHEAAGKPDATAEETILSEGALRMRVDTMRREIARMPASVYSELRGVERELIDHEHLAAILTEQADRADEDAEREDLLARAQEAEDLAARLDAKREHLQTVAHERDLWREETALTRELGERALMELANRQVPVDDEPDRVTAEEWLATHRAAMAAEDPHRVITAVDVPREVYDYDLDDLVQIPDAIAEAPSPADEHADVAGDVVDAVVVVDAPQQLEMPEPDAADVVDAEVLDEDDEDYDLHAAAEPVKATVIVEDENGDGQGNVAGREDSEPDVIDAEVVEDEPVAEAPADDEPEIADDVPSDVEVEVAAAAARVAAAELDDRHNQERERETRVGYRHHVEEESAEAARQHEEAAVRTQTGDVVEDEEVTVYW